MKPYLQYMAYSDILRDRNVAWAGGDLAMFQAMIDEARGYARGRMDADDTRPVPDPIEFGFSYGVHFARHDILHELSTLGLSIQAAYDAALRGEDIRLM